MLLANRTQNIEVIARTTALVVKADWIFTGAWGILQPITGGALIILKGYTVSSFWVMGSITGYCIAGAFWLPVVYFQIQLRNMALQALHTHSSLPSRYYRFYRYWFMCGWPAFISLMGVFYLMTNGPRF
jgi:uncharacterized membrane protein